MREVEQGVTPSADDELEIMRKSYNRKRRIHRAPIDPDPMHRLVLEAWGLRRGVP